jgi:sortase A
VTAGLIILLFVGFQTVGTNIIESHTQDQLRSQIAPTIQHAARITGPLKTAELQTPPPRGTPIAILKIPTLGLDTVVIQGTKATDLQRGPGHYIHTPLPGEPGNVGIAGHRTTWGRPFYNLDSLPIGTHIVLASPQGTFTYKLTRLFVVDPSAVRVLKPTATPILTITTCNPRFSAAQRLVARAVLVRSSLSPVTTVRWSTPAPAKPDPSRWPALLWAIAALVVVTATVILLNLTRRRRRWIVLVAGLPASIGLCLVAFVALTPFLPANL